MAFCRPVVADVNAGLDDARPYIVPASVLDSLNLLAVGKDYRIFHQTLSLSRPQP
jgi:hypothetical protein